MPSASITPVQQIINNGDFLDDPSAESVYLSFEKSKINFQNLWNMTKNQGYEKIFLSLSGIDTDHSEMTYISNAINRGKPIGTGYGGAWTVEPAGKKPLFYTMTPIDSGGSTGPASSPSYVYRFYRIHKSGQIFGGNTGVNVAPSDISPAGSYRSGTNPELYIDLEDIGSNTVWSALNVGKPAPNLGDPWTISGMILVTAKQNGIQKTWNFVGNQRLGIDTGLWGGDDITNPNYLAATEQDFDLLSNQPELPGSGASQEDQLELIQDYATIGTIAGETQKKYNERNQAIIAALIGNVPHPTYTPPAVSMTTPSALQKVGASYNVNLTLTYNQNDGGGVTTYSIEKNGTEVSNTNTFSETLTVPLSITTYKGTVNYAQGPVKNNSIGIPDPVGRIPAGSKSVTRTIEGVYPLFGTTSSITVGTEQPLVSMEGANNVVINLVAESGGNKQFFDIPQDWLDARPLTKIEFFDFNTNAWNSQNQLSTFTAVANTHVVNGNIIDYKRYTNNGSNRGEIRMRLIF